MAPDLNMPSHSAGFYVPPSDAESCAACGKPSTFRVQIVKQGATMPDMETGVKAANEHWETFIRGATLLLGGNGVGFGGCLTMLKDGVPSMPGVGLFICLFGLGLLFSIVYYVALTINKIELQQAIVSGEAAFTRGFDKLAYVGLGGGIGFFGLAVIIAMVRFASV